MRNWLALLILTAAAAHADVLVRVRPHVVVMPDSDVRLLQLIDAPALSKGSQDKLAKTLLSKAPAYGERQELTTASLMPLLRDVIESERSRGKERVHLVLPRRVIIDTLRRELNSDLVATELTQAWQPLCSDCQLSVEGLSLPRVEAVRDWSLKIKAELPRGSFSVPVDLIKENGALVPAWISGRLIAKRKVPVTKRMMNIGERIQPGDVAWEYRDTANAYDGIPTAEEMVGKKMRQALRAGEPVWRSLLEKEKAIRRGESIQVRSAEGPWEITLNVVAQQDAYIGDMVTLKNPRTNTSLMGEVVGFGEVEIR